MTSLGEITRPVDLCDSSGRLNPAAVGWSRAPLHRANLTGRGRTKRWEYWAVASPRQVLGVTVSDLDYASLHAVYFLAPDGSETVVSTLVPLTTTPLPDRSGAAPVRVRVKGLSIDLMPVEGGMELAVASPRLSAQVRIDRPEGHEALGVVVPWSPTRFQYTVKENTLPATGHVTVDGRVHPFGSDSWATLDHGRGRWPYRVTWNWGSGSGTVDGRTIGVQVGGKCSSSDWLRPWQVCTPHSERVDLTFTPLHVRTDRINLGVLFNDTHQAFGVWTGTMRDDAGDDVRVDGVRGWAEEVVNRW